MMKYMIILRWNNTVVLNGTCATVVAAEITRSFIYDNMTGKARLNAKLPSLQQMLDAKPGQSFSDVVSDETGTATYQLECIAAQKDADA